MEEITKKIINSNILIEDMSHIVTLSTDIFKRDLIEKALEKYSKNTFSLGPACEFAQVCHWRFLEILHEKKIHLKYDVAELERDLKITQ